jgi:4-hydroxybenzoate polyprenyltransferase
MNLLTLFEVFLLALSFYGLANYSGASQYTIPMACLFCIFWVQKLEKRRKEEEEIRKRVLEYRLKKHRESEEKGLHKARTAHEIEI